MISLAGKVWNRDTTATIRKLVDTGASTSLGTLTQEEIGEYVREHLAKPHGIAAFWAQCQQTHRTHYDPGLRALQRKYRCDSPGDDWAVRGGRLINSATKEQIISFLASPSHPKIDRALRQHTRIGSPQLPGRGWRDTLIIPYNDMPDRILGFVFIGRDGNPAAGDWIYRRVVCNNSTGNEAGLFMLDTLLQPSPSLLKNTAFVCTDLMIALQLQLQHLREHSRPLPLAATWLDGVYETASVLSHLPHHDLVFWGDPVLATKYAKQVNGRVALPHKADRPTISNLTNRGAKEWLYKLKLAAVSWQRATHILIRNRNPLEVEALLGRLNLHGDELRQFADGCPADVREVLRQLDTNNTHVRRVKFETHWVYEREDCWYAEKTGDLITEAVPRIDYVITQPGTKPISYYRGVIKYRGQQYPFTELAARLDKNLLNWVQQYLRDVYHLGVIRIDTRWGKRALQLTRHFKTPEPLVGVTAIGWDVERSQYNFPQFSIRRGGECVHEPACLFTHPGVPGRELKLPGVFSPEQLGKLSENHTPMQIAWATMAHVLANLLAPACNKPARGLLLAGTTAQTIGMHVATKLGCITIPYQKGTWNTDGTYKERINGTYPVCLTNVLPAQYNDLPGLRAIIGVAAESVGAIALQQPWSTITCEHVQFLDTLPPQGFENILPSYLQDVFRRRFVMAEAHADFTIQVLYDLADWFYRAGGEQTIVRRAAELFRQPADCFLELVFQLYHVGEFSFATSKHDATNLPKSELVSTVHAAQDVLWIAQDRFVDAARRLTGITLNPLLVTQALAQEGVLLAEPVYRDDLGWLVPITWWKTHFETWRSAC